MYITRNHTFYNSTIIIGLSTKCKGGARDKCEREILPRDCKHWCASFYLHHIINLLFTNDRVISSVLRLALCTNTFPLLGKLEERIV